jgi:hypothetical protein
MKRRTKQTSNTIAFRAPSELLASLDADCSRLNLSRGELVRAIVSLHYESQPSALRDDVSRLLAKISMIHRNQARMLVSLLTADSKLPLEEAKQVARTNLLS